MHDVVHAEGRTLTPRGLAAKIMAPPGPADQTSGPFERSDLNSFSIQIDSVHCRAITEEIGYRLGLALRKENPKLPPRLEMLLDRLRLQDLEPAPSIAPSRDDMVPRETRIPA